MLAEVCLNEQLSRWKPKRSEQLVGCVPVSRYNFRNSRRTLLRKYNNNRTFFLDTTQAFGYPALFYVFIGGRGCGKTCTAGQGYCLKQFFKKGQKFLWLRLKEPSVKKLLANDAKDFIDDVNIQKYKITGLMTKGDTVYVTRGDPSDKSTYREMCKILALSTFYQTKGVALNKGEIKIVDNKRASDAEAKQKIKQQLKKYRNIVLDEMNAERSEKKTFDITYAFVNQLETICRLDLDRRIILLGNTLEEGSDILANAFNFIPNDFGIYYIKKKRAVIQMIEDSDKYKQARKNSIAGILTPNESTFTNKIDSDVDLIYKGKQLPKPSMIIRFENDSQYVLCGNVITRQKVAKGSKLPIVALKPYLVGVPYDKELANQVITNVQLRLYNFDMLMTLKKFMSEIKLLKGG